MLIKFSFQFRLQIRAICVMKIINMVAFAFHSIMLIQFARYGEINLHCMGNLLKNDNNCDGTILLVKQENLMTMKELILFVGILIIGYIISMGIFYAAFRIFFPVVVENDQLESPNEHTESGSRKPLNKASQDSNIRIINSQLHKINLAHG